MRKYEVSIEYGPTAADVHYVTVDADSQQQALIKGQEWADQNGMRSVLVCNATEMDEEDNDFTDIIEWTPEEEEAFLNILDDSENA